MNSISTAQLSSASGIRLTRPTLVIAELRGKNANVFYETGYAHALGKRVILLAKEAGDILFDLNQLPHIIHGGTITTIRDELRKKIRWAIDNPVGSIARTQLALQVYSGGILLQPNGALACRGTVNQNSLHLHIKLDLHNPVDRGLPPINSSRTDIAGWF